MKNILYFLICGLSFPAFAYEQCEKMTVSGVKFYSSMETVENELGPFSKKNYYKDIETSGQHSGWSLSRTGLEVFIADIGGLTYARITVPEYVVSGKYKVNNIFSEYSGNSNVEIFPCSELSATEQRILLDLNSNGVILTITIEDYGL